jgi:hypothetical protein
VRRVPAYVPDRAITGGSTAMTGIGKRTAGAALVVALCLSLASGVVWARTTIVLAPASRTVIRGDVLWMRIARDGSLLAPFAIDVRGRWCWAPADVFQESCTVTVSRRRHGRRVLANGSKVRVRVTYAKRF